jgi:hypothetical protein
MYVSRPILVVLIIAVLLLLAWLSLEHERRKHDLADARRQRDGAQRARSDLEQELREMSAERDIYRTWVADLEQWCRERKRQTQESITAGLIRVDV